MMYRKDKQSQVRFDDDTKESLKKKTRNVRETVSLPDNSSNSQTFYTNFYRVSLPLTLKKEKGIDRQIDRQTDTVLKEKEEEEEKENVN